VPAQLQKIPENRNRKRIVFFMCGFD